MSARALRESPERPPTPAGRRPLVPGRLHVDGGVARGGRGILKRQPFLEWPLGALHPPERAPLARSATRRTSHARSPSARVFRVVGSSSRLKLREPANAPPAARPTAAGDRPADQAGASRVFLEAGNRRRLIGRRTGREAAARSRAADGASPSGAGRRGSSVTARPGVLMSAGISPVSTRRRCQGIASGKSRARRRRWDPRRSDRRCGTASATTS